jgi:GH24 family phage-related lysozyme (muramidase)
MVTNNDTVQSLFTKMDDKKTSGKSTSNISAISSSDDINETIKYFKDAEGVVLRPYWDYNHWRIGIGSDTYVDTDGKQKEVGGKDGKNKSIKPNLKITKEQAYADVKIRLERDFKPGVVKSLGSDNYNKLSSKQQAALLSYAYNTGVGSSKSGTGFGGLIKKGLREAIQSGDTLSASNIISKGITTAKDTSTGVREVVPALVKRRKEESEMFKQDSIKAPPTATMNIKPQSSGLSAAPQATVGSLSAPTQATGRNIETTSQILNSAPSVTTAQNSQPVVINNINAPTVASSRGSSGPAIELSVFRNIDNSILANTNRHLRAGILGV